MLTVATFKWHPPGPYRSQFSGQAVNVLRSMVARHYPDPHRFVCITDDTTGIDPGTETYPLWATHSRLQSPHGPRNPSCYRRLPIFDGPFIRPILGERFVVLDLDVVICRDMRPVWNRPEEFVIYGDTAKGTPYNGSMQLHTAGARQQVWDQFDPIASPKRGRALGYIGSDQAWIGACLGPGEAKWTRADGVYSYRNEIAPPRGSGLLPPDARIVIMHGHVDPWQPSTQARHRWVKEHYR